MVPYLNQAFIASLVTDLCMDGWISQTRNKSCTQESQDSKTFTFKLYLSLFLLRLLSLSLSHSRYFVCLANAKTALEIWNQLDGENFHSFKFEIFLKLSEDLSNPEELWESVQWSDRLSGKQDDPGSTPSPSKCFFLRHEDRDPGKMKGRINQACSKVVKKIQIGQTRSKCDVFEKIFSSQIHETVARRCWETETQTVRSERNLKCWNSQRKLLRLIALSGDPD